MKYKNYEINITYKYDSKIFRGKNTLDWNKPYVYLEVKPPYELKKTSIFNSQDSFFCFKPEPGENYFSKDIHIKTDSRFQEILKEIKDKINNEQDNFKKRINFSTKKLKKVKYDSIRSFMSDEEDYNKSLKDGFFDEICSICNFFEYHTLEYINNLSDDDLVEMSCKYIYKYSLNHIYGLSLYSTPLYNKIKLKGLIDRINNEVQNSNLLPLFCLNLKNKFELSFEGVSYKDINWNLAKHEVLIYTRGDIEARNYILKNKIKSPKRSQDLISYRFQIIQQFENIIIRKNLIKTDIQKEFDHFKIIKTQKEFDHFKTNIQKEFDHFSHDYIFLYNNTQQEMLDSFKEEEDEEAKNAIPEHFAIKLENSRMGKVWFSEGDGELIDLKIENGGDFEVNISGNTYDNFKKLNEIGIKLTFEDISEYNSEVAYKKYRNISLLHEKVDLPVENTDEPDLKQEISKILFDAAQEQKLNLSEFDVKRIINSVFELDYMYYSFYYGFKLYCVKVIHGKYDLSNGTPHRKILEEAVKIMSNGTKDVYSSRGAISTRRELDISEEIPETIQEGKFGNCYYVYHKRHEFDSNYELTSFNLDNFKKNIDIIR